MQLIKSEKWAPRALKRVLVGYDGHIIYRVYIKSQKKVIRVKGLRIFEDRGTKATTELPDHDEGTPTFQRFFFEDNDEKKTGLLSTCKSRKVKNGERKQPAPIAHAGQKVNDAEPKLIACTGRKVINAEPFFEPIFTTGEGSRADDAELLKWQGQEPPAKGVTKSRSGRRIKMSTKAQEAVTQITLYQDAPSTAKRNSEVEKLVLHLKKQLNG